MHARTPLTFHALVLTAVFLCLDRVTKHAAMAHIPDAYFIHPNLLRFVHHENFGIIANVPVPQWLTILVTVAFIGVILHLLHKYLARRAGTHVIFLSVLLAGALGNLWDRVTQGYVFDWILLFNRSVINLADVMIVTGIAGILILEYRLEKSPRA